MVISFSGNSDIHPLPLWQGVFILGGVTASGKSALAVQMALNNNAAIINADAMQCYQGLPILSAQPTAAEQQGVDHQLYSEIPSSDTLTAADWCALALIKIDTALKNNKNVLVVGGSGLYLKALLHGLPTMPPINDTIRQEVRQMPLDELQRRVDSQNPNPRRLQRALEVLLSTGKPLSYWHALPTAPPPWAYTGLFLLPEDRGVLYERINNRVRTQIANGALEEVAALPAPVGGISKTHGYPELCAVLAGRLSLEEAIQQTAQNVRHYAKRQYTFFKGQF